MNILQKIIWCTIFKLRISRIHNHIRNKMVYSVIFVTRQPYVMHMMAPYIILYQEKYIQKFYHVYVSICYVVWYFIDFPITWFSETCVNNKKYFIFFLIFFLISLFPYIFWLPYECKSFANKYSFIHFTWHIFGEQQHHVYYQLFSLHTIYLHCNVICWKTCTNIFKYIHLLISSVWLSLIMSFLVQICIYLYTKTIASKPGQITTTIKSKINFNVWLYYTICHLLCSGKSNNS